MTDRYLKAFIKNDPHASPWFRINGPYANSTHFYQDYDLKAGQKMYSRLINGQIRKLTKNMRISSVVYVHPIAIGSAPQHIPDTITLTRSLNTLASCEALLQDL